MSYPQPQYKFILEGRVVTIRAASLERAQAYMQAKYGTVPPETTGKD